MHLLLIPCHITLLGGRSRAGVPRDAHHREHVQGKGGARALHTVPRPHRQLQSLQSLHQGKI